MVDPATPSYPKFAAGGGDRRRGCAPASDCRHSAQAERLGKVERWVPLESSGELAAALQGYPPDAGAPRSAPAAAARCPSTERPGIPELARPAACAAAEVTARVQQMLAASRAINVHKALMAVHEDSEFQADAALVRGLQGAGAAGAAAGPGVQALAGTATPCTAATPPPSPPLRLQPHVRDAIAALQQNPAKYEQYADNQRVRLACCN